MFSCLIHKYYILMICSVFVLVNSIMLNGPMHCYEDINTYTYNNQLYQIKVENLHTLEEIPVPYTVVSLMSCITNAYLKLKGPTYLDPSEVLKSHDHADLWFMAVPPMPESVHLRAVSYRDAIPRNVWGHCELGYLYIQRANTSLMPSNWLANCTGLRLIHFNSVSIAVVRDVLDTVPAIELLTATNIDGIADILEKPLFPTLRGTEKRITKIIISIRSETSIARDVWPRVSLTFIRQLSSLPRLEDLNIDFQYFQMCSGDVPSVTFNSLRFLSVSDASTARLCFKRYILMPKVEKMGLETSWLSEIEFSELYSSPAPKFSVSFDGHFNHKLRFTREDYLSLTDGVKKGAVSIWGKMSLECDCGQSLWLARAMRENLVQLTDVTCADRSPFESQKCELLECDRVYCDGPCLCCRGENDTVIADCRDTPLVELPKCLLELDNLTCLLAPNNDIKILPKDLPTSLKLLDVSDNNVWLGSTAEEAKTLFKEKLRKLRLAGNSLICSCANEILLELLQENSDQIEDYENISCVDDGKKLKEVNLKVLCASRDRDAAILHSTSVALVVVTTTLILGTAFYYRRAVQTFFFARGLCLCCIQEDDLDADRIYDIFLSFCHADEYIVIEQLLKKLDEKYSVCVHFRDWYPGEVIPMQIANSIERSRRTLVVMSRNFVKSLWGLLEFRTAYASGLTEGRIRVVMVVLDNVLDEKNLEGEIRSYVRFNTYVKWGDPWFWDKLKFALPHNPCPRVLPTYVTTSGTE